MTAYRHLPASAASVLLGTALLLACAPKAQAAEKTTEETATQTKSELVQKQSAEPEKPAAGDAAEAANTEEGSRPAVEADKKQATTEEKPAKSEQPTVVAGASGDKQEAKAKVVNSPAPKPQARDAEEPAEPKPAKPVPDNVKSALDKAFADFKFLELPIDTTVGKLPDPSELLLKNVAENSLQFAWKKAPDVSSTGEKDAVVTVTILNSDGSYSYDVNLHTKVNVWQKESDYAMVYGEPGPGMFRKYLMIYDADLKQVIAKRAYYVNDVYNPQLDESGGILSGTLPESMVFGYVPAVVKYQQSDYQDKLNDVLSQYELSVAEKDVVSTIFNKAKDYAQDSYSPYPTAFQLGIHNDDFPTLVYYVASDTPRNIPNINEPGYWLGYGEYDFADQLPDPRFFINNWEMMPAGATAKWTVPPTFDDHGSITNADKVTIEVNAGGVTTLVNKAHGYDIFTPFHLPYNNTDWPVLYSEPRQTEKGQLPAPSAFFKRPVEGVDPSTAFWVIKPDVTKAGWTHGIISYAGNRRIVVFLQVNEPAKPQPKPDPEPQPKPDPKPDPEPEPEPKPDPDPDPDPIPVPKPDPKPDIAEDPDKDHDDDKPEDKKPEQKQPAKRVVTKTSIVKQNVTKPVAQTKRASLPQTGNKGLLMLALGAAISIIGLGLLRKKKA
jgi:LPXTG-motif cell wall-anchored protein